jgi:hypothetical protein
MKNSFTHFFSILLFLGGLPALSSAQVIWSEDFETNGENTRYTSPNLFFGAFGNDDYWGRSDGNAMTYDDPAAPGSAIAVIGTGSPGNQTGAYSGFTGTYLFVGEDLDDTGGAGNPDGSPVKEIIFSNIDITGYTDLTFKGLFGAGVENSCGSSQFDGDDYIKVFFEVDAGGENSGLCFHADIGCQGPGDVTDEPLHFDPDCDGDGGDGVMLTNALQEFSFPIPEGSTLNLRIEVRADADGEEVAFDNLRVEGIEVVCTEAPEITCPGNQTETGDENCNVALPDYTGLATVTDDCDPSPVVTQSPTPATQVSGSTTVTLTATDNDGNTSTCSFLVDVVDNDAPTLNVPAAVTLGCGDETEPPAIACGPIAVLHESVHLTLPPSGALTLQAAMLDAGSIDGCGTGSLTFEFSIVPGSGSKVFDCADLGTQTQTIYVTDGNGNKHFGEVLITLEDPLDACGGNASGCTPAAVVHASLAVNLPVGESLTLQASDFDAGSLDLCNTSSLSFSFSSNISDQTLTLDCTDLGVNPVTIWVTDNLGNQIAVTSTVEVQDNNNHCGSGGAGCSPVPVVARGLVLTLPPGRTANLPATAFNLVSQDACGSGSLSWAYAGGGAMQTFSCAELGSVPVQLELTDANGNVSEITVFVLVQDANNFCEGVGVATASDNCDVAPVVTYTDAVASGVCPVVEVITRTWTATDAAGNSVSVDQVITIEDNTGPAITCPDPQTGELDENCEFILPNYTTLVTAGDNCNGPVNLSQSPAAGTPVSLNTTITITATDACGNSESCFFQLTVSDGIDPEVTCPDDQTVLLNGDCEFVLPDYSNLLDVSDNCDVSPGIVQTPMAGTIITDDTTIDIDVTDASGNAASCSFSVLVDSSDPFFTSTPNDLTVSCENNVPGEQGVIAQDDCDGQIQVFFTQSGLPLDCPGEGTVINTWTATDSHGNTIVHTQVVTVLDQAGPVLTSTPSDLVVSCVDEVPGDQGVAAIDDCTGSVNVVFIQSDLPSCAGSGTVTNTWIAQDCAGNSTVYTQTVTISDTEAPVFSSLPGAITVNCLDDVPGEQGVSASDNCGQPIEVTFSQTPLPGCPNGSTVTNTWTATDCAGNVSTHSQTVTVEDTEAPVLSATPASLTVTCVNNVPGDPGITAVDACQGPVNVTFSQSPLPGCAGDGVVVNTWSAADCAGNIVSHTQIVTIEDNLAPVLSSTPPNLTVSCSTNVPGDPGITATDNCDGPLTVTFSQSPLPSCDGSGTVTNTWTATDCAGNTTTHQQVITIDDTTPPVLSGQPSNLVVSCWDDVPGDPGITATDNCSGAVTVVFAQSAPPACIGDGTVTNTWTATDCAGNITVYEQQVTIEDTTPPVFSQEPQHIIVACLDDVPGDPGVTATDNCGEVLSVQFQQSALPACAGQGLIVNTWTVTDCAGNTATHIQEVTIDDNTPPVLSITPPNQTVNCESLVPGDPGVTATDNCGGQVDVTFTQTGLPLTFPNPDPVINTWTATDCAGNTVSYTQIVTVDDKTAPNAQCQNISANLDATGNLTLVPEDLDNGSTDNCGISSMSLDLSAFDCDMVGVHTVTLTVTDDFGNEDACTGQVSVIASAVCPTPDMAYSGGPNISDPCSCLGNGVFGEEVVVGPDGVGQNWTVVSTTLLNPATNQPYAAGTPLTEVSAGPGQSIYVISGEHLDGQGYTIEVESPFYPGVVLSISNTCYYPEPEIIGLDGPFCLYSDPVTLEGDVNGVALISEEFTINGIPAIEFDPFALGVGIHQVIYTVDAGTASPMDPTDPGCVAEVLEFVQVSQTPSQVTCNNSLTVALDQNCEALITADMILEGSYPCFDDYSVTILDGINVIGNPVTGDYIGDNLTAIVTHLVSGNSCSGSITVFDNLPPVFDCPAAPVVIGCTEEIEAIPSPIATDNCSAVTYLLVDEIYFDTDICDDDIAQVERVWKAVDIYGNESATCSQLIQIERPDDVDFPNNIQWSCTQDDVYPNILDPVALHPAVKALENGTLPINATGLTNPTVLGNTGSGIPLDLDGQYCGYSYSYSDEILSGCGSTYQIVRTWTVLDWCTNNIITSNGDGEDNIQLVSVQDNVAPTITRSPFTVSANVYGDHPDPCTSQDFLLPATVTDNCHDWTIRIFTPVGEAEYVNGVDGSQGGLIPSPGLTLGTHNILYQATDECNNVAELIVPIEVIDDIAPVAICDEITTIALSSDGLATVNASIFDDGSLDNCCIDYFEVARLSDNCDIPGNTDFNPTTVFCCADIDTNPVAVQVRVYDCFGNFNDCTVSVFVEDKLSPNLISCPPAQTITCETYLEDLAAGLEQGDSTVLEPYGTPQFYDNCSFEVDYEITTDINTCSAGTITRKWTASDPSGNGVTSCTQVLTVEHVSNWVVEFPEDITAECQNGMLPDFGEPEVFFDDCELIGQTFDDQYFYVVPDACYKIVRTWEVINWCLYDEFGSNVYSEFSEDQVSQDFDGDGDTDERTFKDGVNNSSIADGYIAYTQVIKVIDNEDPVFTLASQFFCINETDCGVDITLPNPDVEDCSDNITFNIQSNLPNGSGFGPYTDVPPGTYIAEYAVSDNCGNTSYDQISITVEDCKAPTPVCQELIVEMMQTGMVPVSAEMLDASSFDNCSGELQFSFSSDVNDTEIIFDCDDLGLQDVEIWVTDEAGNQAFCETLIIVQDNMGHCIPIFNVGGLIEREDDMPVENVEVDVNGGLFTMYTNASGMYDFDLQGDEDYTVKPALDTLHSNGVSTLDMVLIQQHILGMQPLGSPYKIIAGDVNGSNSLTTLDLVDIKLMVLSLIEEFPNAPSWRFVDADYIFPNPENPWQEFFPEVVSFNNLAQDEPAVDFVAVKMGDVNYSANTFMNFQGGGSQGRNLGAPLQLAVIDQAIQAGTKIEVPILVADDRMIRGFQYTFNFATDALELVDVVPAKLSEEDLGMAFTEEGAVTVSWYGSEPEVLRETTLFTLVFRARATEASLQDLCWIDSRITSMEAIDESWNLLDIQLSTEDQAEPVSGRFELYQNRPNPFVDKTAIGFHLPVPTEASLRVFDASGREVWSRTATLPAGYHEYEISDLPGHGVYFYQLSTSEQTATRKMILQR